ncbi:MAG: hypothetical protein MZV63_71560 [Marinilabiliales bacterium]|nr:hypothetical protein [Marinilabiliales bacterium]
MTALLLRRGELSLKARNTGGRRYGFNAKLNNKGDFYASVRGPLGIELIRILAVGNDICSNSQAWTRTVYVGKKDADDEEIRSAGRFLYR